MIGLCQSSGDKMGLSYGDDYEYAKRNLVGSIVMHKGKPCNIMEIGGGKVRAYYLANDQIFIDALANFDINAFRLGYVNYPTYATYVSRIPARQWRQGLTNNTVVSVDRFGVKLDKYIVPTILNQYPSFTFCVEQCVEEEAVKSKAFSRSFSVYATPNSKKVILNFKGIAVADIVDYKPIWIDGKQYLLENFNRDSRNGH